MIFMGTKENEAARVTGHARFCANGETFAGEASMAIPCQAAGDFGPAEGVETRGPSSNGNDPHERPTPHPHVAGGEDIVRHPRETLGAVLNRRHNGCKNLTYEMEEIKLFKTIPKVPATNTVEEFNRLLAYSQSGSRRFNLGWMAEGDLPEEEDSTYARITVLVKFLGVTGRVTHVANTIRAAFLGPQLA